MNSRPSLVSSALLLHLVVGTWTDRAPGQCATQWLPGVGIPGTDGTVFATTLWDPDGPGPRQHLLVVGGAFSVAGTVAASNIAVWDPATGVWSPVGSGTSGNVVALAALPNGDLVAGGEFTSAGGAVVNFIASWNGIGWSALGTGM